MNTTTAAATAKVTVATIRDWARRGIIAATKVAGRWVIDTNSLTHRINIGAMKRPAKKQAPMQLSLGHTWTNRHRFTVVGPATQLQNAFSSGTPVTLTGEDCTGDRVYLGVTRQTYGDMGVTMETLGLDAHLGEDASYLIDTQRLAEAPQLAAIIASEQARADQIDAEVAAQDDRYLDSDYE